MEGVFLSIKMRLNKKNMVQNLCQKGAG